jgi:ABC-type uncharacterized transport system ATPase subunit
LLDFSTDDSGGKVRFRKISIVEWRNFRGIEIEVPKESTLICLVGENGTGKSNLLELLSAALQVLGVSEGVEIPRGNPFDELHQLTVVLEVTRQPESFPSENPGFQDQQRQAGWDGTLELATENEGTARNQTCQSHFPF